MNKYFRKFLKWLPVSWKARLEYHFDSSLGKEFGGPFNGQRFRQEMFADLVRAVPFNAIVETGTFRGVTTAFIAARTSAPIFTVESEPRFYHFARLNLKKHVKVQVTLGDSRAFLNGLVENEAVPKDKVFFYLDAHWNEDLPLQEEVRLIADNWSQVVIMIDDFEVPGDADYRFDDYGDGKRLSLDYLGSDLLSQWRIYFPAGRGSDDTGIKRGCIVLASKGLRNEVDQIPSLRPYEMHEESLITSAP